MSKLVVLACAPLVNAFTSSMESCTTNVDCTTNPGEFCIPAGDGADSGTICWETPAGAAPIVGGVGMEWCQPGTYAPKPINSLQCYTCENGKYQDEAEQSECDCVPAGQRAVAYATLEPCPIGTYYPEDCHPTAGCLACEPGMFASDTGALECECSKPGHGSDELRAAEEQCPKGFYSAAECDPCVQCPQGKFASELGMTECEDAPPGTHPNDDLTGTVECQPGFEQPLPGQASCSSCPSGKYTGDTGSTGCECAGDGKEPTADSTGTQDCPAGVKSELDEATGCKACTTCMDGHYSDPGNVSSCSCADPGYRPAGDAHSQVPCELGHFSLGCNGTCTACEPGTFAETEGSANCTQCPAGKFGVGSGLTACVLADPGHFVPEAGSYEALPCEAGYYQEQAGQVECKACPLGKFANLAGMTKCINASVGHTSAVEANVTTGYSVEVPCPAGQVAPEEGVGCTLCKVGKYQSESGKSSCTCVDPGYYSNSSGQGQTKCAVGYMQPLSCGEQCLPCGPDTPTPGAPSDEGGWTSCDGAGAVVASVDNATCDDKSIGTCCPGKYWSKLMLRCEHCAPGHFSTLSADQCESCPPGEYQDERGQSECKSCAGKGFADSKFAIQCEACSFFEHSPADGSGESCQSCFASVHTMFSWDFCLVETIASIACLFLVVGGSFIVSRRLVGCMQPKSDANQPTKDPEAAGAPLMPEGGAA